MNSDPYRCYRPLAPTGAGKTGCDLQGRFAGQSTFNNAAQFATAMSYIKNSHPNTGVNERRWVAIFYGAEIQVRYVILDTISVDEFDGIPVNVPNVHLVSIKNRDNGGYAGGAATVDIKGNVTINFKAWGTCATPSVTVNFNTVFATGIPDVGDTTGHKDFNLELSKCPNLGIIYFFRSPAGISANSVNGVLGLDSTAGNAQHVGVQLRHNGGYGGHQPIQFNQDGNTTTYSRTFAMAQPDPDGGYKHIIPMRAAIYRTSAAPVVGGTTNTSVLVYIQYQ